MSFPSNSALHIDLTKKEFAIKSYPELREFVGGVGTASKLILDNIEAEPVVFSVGPMNGYFPFASKACAAFIDEGKFVDTYVGGKLSTRLSFCGMSSVVFEGKSSEPVLLQISEKGVVFFPENNDPKSLGTPGRKVVVTVSENEVGVSDYFHFGNEALARKLYDKGIRGLVVYGSLERSVENPIKYEKLYLEILGKVGSMLVTASDKPSCSGCPMGCDKSSVGENGGNVFVHSLVSCTYAEAIYSDIPTVFACLSSLGYDYVHEELESLPDKIYKNIRSIYEKIGNSELETK